MRFIVIGTLFMASIITSAIIISSTAFSRGNQDNEVSLSQARPAIEADSWKPYASCETRQSSENTIKLSSCFKGENFFVDGPQLLKLVVRYVCSPSKDRTSFVFTIGAPSLTSSLKAIASKKLQSRGMSRRDRTYVEPIVKVYDDSVRRASNIYPLLLKNVVNTLEAEDKIRLTNHKVSKNLRKALSIPTNCSVRKSKNETQAVIVIANETIQRFSRIYWRWLTNTIARANKTSDVNAARLIIPQFVLSENTEDSVARVYNAKAPNSGLYPEGFVKIDIAVNDSTYSVFAVPMKYLPKTAAQFLGKQSDVISSQLGKIINSIENNESSLIVVKVPSPDSARVFPNIFWAEHILWQVAFRALLIKESIILNPNKYRTYGLH